MASCKTYSPETFSHEEYQMFTKTKIVLAAALFATASSVATAQGFDPNLANRYPAYANPSATAPKASAHRGTLQSAPVALRQVRSFELTNEQSDNGSSA